MKLTIDLPELTWNTTPINIYTLTRAAKFYADCPTGQYDDIADDVLMAVVRALAEEQAK